MFKNRAGQVRAGWLILLAFIAMMIGQLVFMIPGSILFTALIMMIQPDADIAGIMELLESNPWAFLLMQGGGTAGGILATVLIWRFVNKKPIHKLGFKRPLNDLWYGLFLGAASITVIFIILLATGNLQMENSFLEPLFSTYTITFLILFILVGFFEEMFFRGYLMSTMENTGNKKWVVYLVSAVLFSLMHGTNPNVSVLGLVNIMLVGLLFAYMFDVTKSLWMPIGYHITWNYFQGNVFGFPVSGTPPNGIYRVDTTGGNDLLTGGAFGLEGGMLTTILILIGFWATYMYAGKKGRETSISAE